MSSDAVGTVVERRNACDSMWIQLHSSIAAVVGNLGRPADSCRVNRRFALFSADNRNSADITAQ